MDSSSKTYLMKAVAVDPTITAKAIFHQPASTTPSLLVASNSSTNSSSIGSSTKRRQLLQIPAGINSVQATYFLRTDDPVTVSHRLSAAANEGTLSSRLEQYGIPTEVSGMHLEIFMLPVAPVISKPDSATVSNAGNSSKTKWVDELGTNSIGHALALVAIVAGGAMFAAVLIYLLYRCWRRKQNKQKLVSWSSSKKQPHKGTMPKAMTAQAVSQKHDVAGTADDAESDNTHTASEPAGSPYPSVRRQKLPRCFDYPAPAADFAVRPFFKKPDLSPADLAESSGGGATPTSAFDAESPRSTNHHSAPSISGLPQAAWTVSGQLLGLVRRPNSQQLLAQEHSSDLAGASQGINAHHIRKSNGQLKQQQLASGIAGAALKLPSAAKVVNRPSPIRTSSSSEEDFASGSGPSPPDTRLNKQTAAQPAYSMGRQAFSSWYHAAAAVVAATMEPTPEVQAEIVAAGATKFPNKYMASAPAAKLPVDGEDQGSTRKLGRLMTHREALQAEARAALSSKNRSQAAAQPPAAASNRPLAAEAAHAGRNPPFAGEKWWQY
jgi:hypothetical protein